MADPASRLYELRLASLGDPRVRDAVAGVLGRWAPASATSATALGGTGVVMRLPLGDAEAAALLRDLYGTGVGPAAVILRPVAVEMLRDRTDAAPAFAVFTQNGGRFVPTWNWKAFVFGPLWYLRRGLYAKGVVLFVLGVCPFFTLAVTVLLGGAVLVYCGVAGNWDDYLWRVKGTQWW
jgi:Protein of unknown function (DUF2628)